MAVVITNLIAPKVVSNLDTYNYTVKAAGAHTARIQVLELPPSGISIVIKQNSSTIATFSGPSARQKAIQFGASMNCAINDVIGIILASSTAIDTGRNSFKAIINIHIGSPN